MILHRSVRYRIYPTPEQEARLRAWEGALRALWNAANEQRLVCSRRGVLMPGLAAQQRDLTKARAEIPWLRDVPRDAAEEVLQALDFAWQRCFVRLARAPKWKRKGRDAFGVTEHHDTRFHVRPDAVVFPKIGAIEARQHRPLPGRAKRCTLIREVDQWVAVVTCEREVVEPPRRGSPVVAIDRGVTNLLADSDGALIPNPDPLTAAGHLLARAQRVLGRRRKDSRRCDRARQRVAKLHRKIRRQRRHFLHVLSARYAKSHGVVIVERLNVAGLVRGNVGRLIHGAGWSSFRDMLRYKLEASGGELIEVPAAYSSQTCAACGAIDALNRNRERFRCVACGHEAHADLNAALVLLSRGNRGGAGRGGSGEVGRPEKRQLRVVRRGLSVSDEVRPSDVYEKGKGHSPLEVPA